MLQARVRVGLVEEVGVVEQGHLVADDRHGHAQRLIDRRVPAGVSTGQVIVDGDQVGALAFQRVEVERQHGDQRFALTGFHLGDLSLVQDDAADELHVEGPQADGAAGGFANHGKGLDQHVLDALTLLQSLAELRRPGLQLIVAEFLHQRLELVDIGNPFQVPLDLARVGIA